ncbi:MAG: efflux RND transporter periplasmic adaptor subunit [Rhodobacteraceae bacterium]|nr:efflux RND transporter periplasmic adaptor subunit [Paracoccaceae bacterium]MBR9822293.1 efflux RND transporter periplasmic adaptor subunit [Paracoccaceae bacterium]
MTSFDRPRTRSSLLRGLALCLALGATALGLQAAGGMGGSAAPTPEDAPPPVKLLAAEEVLHLAQSELRETLSISGSAAPVQRVTVSAQVSGLIEAVAVQSGDEIPKGALLLEIAAGDYRLALQAQEASRASLAAQLAAVRAAYTRTQTLADRGVAPRSSLDAARGEVDALTAQIAAAEAQMRLDAARLERARPRAPFAGVVTRRLVEPGQLVQAGAPLVEILDLSEMLVETLVPLDRLDEITPGQQARLWLPRDPDRSFDARVERISPQAVEGTRSARVYLRIPEAGGALPAGLYLSGEILLRSARALALPESAIRQEAETATVLALRGGTLTPVLIGTGPRWQNGSLVEITAGLAPGDLVLARPLANLAEGDSVRLATEE